MNGLKDLAARLITGFHRTVFKISGGRLAKTGFGMPVVMLTTVGRKSGKRRDTMLTPDTVRLPVLLVLEVDSPVRGRLSSARMKSYTGG